MLHKQETVRSSDIENRIFHAFKLVVICMWVVFGTLQKTSIFVKLCSSYVLIGTMLAGAAICILWDFFRIHTLFKNKYTWIYVLFIGATVLSSVFWIRYGIYTNAVIICYLCAELFVMYQVDAERGKAAIFRDFKIICTVVCVLSLMLSLFSLLTYFAYIEFGYVDSSGKVLSQGYYSRFRRVWGVYIETNFQGLMDIFVMYISALLFYKAKGKKEKAFWIINLVIHFVCLVLTSSRSSAIAFFVSVFVSGFFLSRGVIKRNAKLIAELGKRAATGLLATVLAFAVFEGTKTGIPYLQMVATNNLSLQFRLYAADKIDQLYMLNGLDIWGELADYVEPTDPETNEETKKPVLDVPQEIIRQDIEEKEDTSNGRLHVWRDALKLFARFPLIGVSPGNRASVVLDYNLDVCDEIKDGLTLLNGYLEVLSGSGLLGFSILLVFLVACVVRLWGYDRKYGKYGTEVGLILGIIVAQMVFALFLSELFFVKSIHTYLFWIVLGYAMAVIEIEEKDNVKDKDHAFICDTPLQVLNAVSMVVSDADGCAGNSDLFVYHQFQNSHEIANRVRKTGIFRNVYDFEPFPVKSGLVSKFTTFLRIINPRRALAGRFRGKERGYEKQDYRTLALSFYTPFSDIVHLALDTSRTVQFEDGTASYITENLESRYRSGIFEAYNRFIACGKLSYHPEKLYLSNPDFCVFDSIPLEQVHGIGENKQVRRAVKDVFGYRDSVYRDTSVVYLTQPMGPAEGGEPVIAKEREYLPLIRELNPIVRVHPRQTEEAYAGFTIDRVGNMWELECAECIDDSKVLIGAFSTAQLLPKILFNREPTLVFLYQLYGCRFDQADKLVQRMKESYRDPNKVLVPQTGEELEAILKAL